MYMINGAEVVDLSEGSNLDNTPSKQSLNAVHNNFLKEQNLESGKIGILQMSFPL
jgi:hypothetical protein